MERQTKGRAEALLRAKKKKKIWLKAASVMAAVVVFFTTYALILPAITLSGQYACGLEEHVHTDENGCYTEQAVQKLECTLDIHSHTDGCKDENGNLICGYADFVAHKHSALCYSNGALVCTLEEREPHEHTAECFESVLTCGQEAGEGHTHSDACYQLACGQEESGEHSHSEACYTLTCELEQNEGHTHTDTCYTSVQTCEKEEILLHTHTVENGCFDEYGNLTCRQLQILEHVHTENCFQTVLEKVLTCDQTEHTHSEECLPAADGEQEETTPSTEAAVPLCGKDAHTHGPACYGPAEEGAEAVLVCELEEHIHSEECYVTLPEETQPAEYSYQDQSLEVTVVLPAGSTVPEDAELTVQPITETEEKYDTLVSQAEAVSGETVSIRFYEIGFRTQDGEYLPVSEEAKVTIRFLEPLQESGEAVTVLHYTEGTEEPVALSEVEVQRDENDALSELTFQTEGFSVFAVLMADIPVAQAENGNTFTLTYNNYTITFSVVDTAGNAIPGDYSAQNISAKGATQYLFKDIAPKIDGYTYSGATYSGNIVVSVATTGYYNGSSTTSETFQLYVYEPIQSGQWYSRSANIAVSLTYAKENIDYSGDWMIVNLKSGTNSGVAMLAENIGNTDNTNRAGKTVAVVESEGSKYVMDSTVTLWNFERQTDGTYYISTTVNGAEKYLTIGNSINNPVTLSDAPQSITVTEGSGNYAGMVRLTNNGIAVNLFGGSANQGFGCWNDNGENEWQTLCRVVGTGNFLLYDLAVTTAAVGNHIISGASWEEVPELMTTDGVGVANPIQTVTTTGVSLYGPGEPGDDGYFTFVETTRREIRQRLGDAGKEFRFDGWTAPVGEETYVFPAGADAYLTEDGISIADVDGVERVLPLGTTLTAQWTQVSDIVMFFVNYSGTILDTEGDVSGRNQQEFTGIIGIGRIYYGKEQAGSDNVFGGDADTKIRLDFVNQFDPDNPNPQVVMEYVTAYDDGVTSNNAASDPQHNGAGYNLYQSASGINDTELETALLEFIHDNDNVSIKVSTADGTNNPVIENENSTADNYSVRWYVMKEQVDGWHIDGVMVAKTAEITVTKTFSGLTSDQVSGILNNYKMPVKLGTSPQDYITMTTNPSNAEKGQYNYYGQERDASGNPSGQSYTWILNAITDEQYTLSEESYELNGYDVSTIVVNYYTDENGQTQVVSGFASTTGGLSQQVIGGQTTAVSFNNFYTPTGTGAFAIHKSSATGTGEGDVGSALQGAVFTLYTDTSCTTVLATAATNSRGSAYFSGLDPGQYYMKETKAPEGYIASTDTWTVEVEKGSSDKIKVTVYTNDENGNKSGEGTVCYDGGIIASYVIQNTPEAGTVRVTKTFSGLSAVEMEQIVQKSSEAGNGYCIRLQGNVSASGDVDVEGERQAVLYLQNATRGQDGFTFTWMIKNLAMTDGNGKEISYTVFENNYLFQNYQETIITAQVNGTLMDMEIEHDDDMAFFKTTFNPDVSDTVILTNHYTNTFTLTLQKVDANGKRLSDAVFDVYGPYRESKDTSKRITYKDPETGITKIAYFIQTITANSNGIATMEGLNLSSGDNTFVYVINESYAPDGYAKLDEPIVQSVALDDDGYFNGVYTSDVVNIKEEDYVHRTLDTEKVWEPGEPSGAEVTLELYRVSHFERNVPLDSTVEATRVATVTLDGNIDTATDNPGNNIMPPEESGEQTIYAYESDEWTVTWGNLPAAAADEYGKTGEHYHYFVREVAVDGYTADYTCYDENGTQPEGALQTLKVGNETIQGVLLADMDEAYTVSITNTASYELPATGGSGTAVWKILGVIFMLAAGGYGFCMEKRAKRGGVRHL